MNRHPEEWGVIKTIQLEELTGENNKKNLWIRSVGEISLVGVTTNLQVHWLKCHDLSSIINVKWLREVVDESTDRAATASKPS